MAPQARSKKIMEGRIFCGTIALNTKAEKGEVHLKGILLGGMWDKMELEVPQIPPEYVVIGEPPVAYRFSPIQGDKEAQVVFYVAPHHSKYM